MAVASQHARNTVTCIFSSAFQCLRIIERDRAAPGVGQKNTLIRA